jgi:rhodanese-related sulfurtransferase
MGFFSNILESIAPSAATSISGAECLQRLKKNNAKLIDVREKQELKSLPSHPKASNWPLSDFDTYLQKSNLPKDAEILVVCMSGMRSSQAQRILIRSGYTNVTNVQGGIRAIT